MAKMVTFDFEFLDEDEKKHTRKLTVKSARVLPNNIVRKLSLDDPHGVWEAFDWAMNDKDQAWWAGVPSNLNGQPLMEAWQKASGADVGESEASSTS